MIGPGPVVVLIHGFPLDRSMWEAQTAEVGSIYRIIAPDLRGAGSTAAPDGVYTIDLLADDVIETLDALELDEPVVLGGLSMGGYVALSIALRYPDRIRGLMLDEHPRRGRPAEHGAGPRGPRAADRGDGEPRGVVDSMFPKFFAPIAYTRHADLIARLRERALRPTPAGLANTLRGLAVRPDRTADLGRIASPTLVIAGAEDQLIPPAESQILADGIPARRLVTIPDAGHLAPLENKSATNAAILEFLGTLGD